jgi:hypothetical protein
MDLFDIEDEIRKTEAKLETRKEYLQLKIKEEEILGSNAVFRYAQRWGMDPNNRWG